MKKPIVDAHAFEALRSQKLRKAKMEAICIWAFWMAVLTFVGIQMWSEFSMQNALGRTVILSGMALGYISLSAMLVLSLVGVSMANWQPLSKMPDGCQKLATLVEQSSKAMAYRDEVVAERELHVLDLYYAQFIAKDEIQTAWCQKAHSVLTS